MSLHSPRTSPYKVSTVSHRRQSQRHSSPVSCSTKTSPAVKMSPQYTAPPHKPTSNPPSPAHNPPQQPPNPAPSLPNVYPFSRTCPTLSHFSRTLKSSTASPHSFPARPNNKTTSTSSKTTSQTPSQTPSSNPPPGPPSPPHPPNPAS